MGEDAFLLVRLSSLGDVVHALPAACALRESFPAARIDWVTEKKWAPLLENHPDLTRTVSLDRSGAAGIVRCIRELRTARYTCAVDFQSLYKSSLLALAAGARRRIGFDRRYAREGPSAFFYTEAISPPGSHKIEHNLALVELLGARKGDVRYSIASDAAAEAWAESQGMGREAKDYFVLSPGGGWRSKCWPAGRYGELHRLLARETGWRGVINCGPSEKDLASEVLHAAGDPSPLVPEMDLKKLITLLRRAKFVVAADSGPLHLAVALGTPVIGLYGPTDPARNGPFCARDVVVRNARPEETTYERGASYSPAMLSITVEQVAMAVARRMSAF